MENVCTDFLVVDDFLLDLLAAAAVVLALLAFILLLSFSSLGIHSKGANSLLLDGSSLAVVAELLDLIFLLFLVVGTVLALLASPSFLTSSQLSLGFSTVVVASYQWLAHFLVDFGLSWHGSGWCSLWNEEMMPMRKSATMKKRCAVFLVFVVGCWHYKDGSQTPLDLDTTNDYPIQDTRPNLP